MTPKTASKEVTLKGQGIEVEAEVFVCPQCGLEARTLETGGALQKTVANAYLTETGKHT